jgi:hypothetical protein
MAWSGVATVSRMAEWPDWIPTSEIQARLGPFPPRIIRAASKLNTLRQLFLTATTSECRYRWLRLRD